MKLVNIKILALLVISYSFTLIAMVPLSWLLPLVENQLAPLGVKISQVEGTLWQGQGRVNERTIGNVNVQWDAQLLSLFLLKFPMDVKVFNDNAEITGTVTVNPFGISVQGVDGYLDEKAFETLYKAYRADLSGRLQLINITANMSWGTKLGDASGQISWSGGPISIPVGRATQNYDVPMMLGDVSSDDQRWQIAIRGNEKQPYINADVTREGLGTLSIKRELATDMNIPVPGGGSSLFEVSQQVF